MIHPEVLEHVVKRQEFIINNTLKKIASSPKGTRDSVPKGQRRGFTEAKDSEDDEKLYEAIQAEYSRCHISPGEHVGVLAAVSLGEPLTQLTLNSFHSAGKSITEVVSGVPRFTELVNASKNQKSVYTRLYLNETLDSGTIPVVPPVVSVYTRDLVTDIIVTGNNECKWYKAYRLLYEDTKEPEQVVILKLSHEMLYRHRLTPKMIAKMMSSTYDDLVVLHSPIAIGEVHVFVYSEQ